MSKKDNNILHVPEGTKAVHVIKDKLPFPIFIYIKNAKENWCLDFLYENIKKHHYSLEDLCDWCINHKIAFEVLFMENFIKMFFFNRKKFNYYIKIRNKYSKRV